MIRPTMNAVIGCSLLLAACEPDDDAASAGDTPTVAWWLSASFPTDSTVVRGIDVRTIDPQWQRADALDTLDIKARVSQEAVREFAASPLAFSLAADLDRDGIAEELFVGVYETSDGRTGRFVVITRGGRPVRRFAEEGAAGFSALLAGDGEVAWYKCLECDDYESIRWRRGVYVLE